MNAVRLSIILPYSPDGPKRKTHAGCWSRWQRLSQIVRLSAPDLISNSFEDRFSLGPLPNVKRKKEGKKEEKGREEEKEEEEGRKERERKEESVEKEGGGRLGDLSQGPRCP